MPQLENRSCAINHSKQCQGPYFMASVLSWPCNNTFSFQRCLPSAAALSSGSGTHTQCLPRPPYQDVVFGYVKMEV